MELLSDAGRCGPAVEQGVTCRKGAPRWSLHARVKLITTNRTRWTPDDIPRDNVNGLFSFEQVIVPFSCPI